MASPSILDAADTNDLEARWAELMMPEDLVVDEAAVGPRDLKEHPTLATGEKYPPRSMYARAPRAPRQPD